MNSNLNRNPTTSQITSHCSFLGVVQLWAQLPVFTLKHHIILLSTIKYYVFDNNHWLETLFGYHLCSNQHVVNDEHKTRAEN